MKGKLYLIPMTLGDSPLNSVIPTNVQDLCKNIKVFIVENRNKKSMFKID